MKSYKLLGTKGSYVSKTPGKFGGHCITKIYGRLDCPSALRAIAKGGYVQHRVFFATEADAIACGYRPCGVCMKAEYQRWRIKSMTRKPTPRTSHPRKSMEFG